MGKKQQLHKQQKHQKRSGPGSAGKASKGGASDLAQVALARKALEHKKQAAASQMTRAPLAPRSVAELLASASARTAAFKGVVTVQGASSTPGFEIDTATAMQRTAKAYSKELAKVVEASDVILEVLDARDPLGSRSTRVEALVERSGGSKRLVLVLNKVDLVPKEIAAGWLDRLRLTGLAVLAFKASTQKGGGLAGVSAMDGIVKDAAVACESAMAARSTALGVDSLLQLLKNYARDGSSNSKKQGSLVVGVVGFPNAGKSSLIRSLVGARSNKTTAGAVSATAGSTTALREVRLDSHLMLIDSPGVVAIDAPPNGRELASLLIRGCVESKDLRDAPEAVHHLLEAAGEETLRTKYADFLPEKLDRRPDGAIDANKFLAHVARHRGKLKRGGIPDIEAAARDVILDFKRGALDFYSEPPAKDISLGEATIVPRMQESNFDPSKASEPLVVNDRPEEPTIFTTTTTNVPNEATVDSRLVFGSNKPRRLEEDDDEMDD